MTRHEWLGCDDPQKMLAAVAQAPETRRPSVAAGLRRFMLDCGWRVAPLRPGPEVRAFLDECENGTGAEDGAFLPLYVATQGWPRGQVTNALLQLILNLRVGLNPAGPPGEVFPLLVEHARLVARAAVKAVRRATPRTLPRATRRLARLNRRNARREARWQYRVERETQADQLRLLIGYPFRPAEATLAFRSPLVQSLAGGVYEEPLPPGGALDPFRLAVLADAMEEAGCVDEEILTHLRRPVARARRSWVVDLVAPAG